MALPMILIGGTVRSGGSLLSRLLDGNNALAVYPYDFQFYHRHFAHPWYPKWPYINGPIKNNSQLLKKYLHLQSWFRVSQEGQIRKAGLKHINLQANSALFYHNFAQELTKYGSTLLMRDVYDVLNKAFFESIDLQTTEFRYVVAHWPEMYCDADTFFQVYPDGYFFQTLRDLKGFACSIKKWAQANGQKTVEPQAIARLWLVALEMAIVHLLHYSTQYCIVMHSSLIQNTKNEIKEVCDQLDILMSEINTKPTFGQHLWHGNMSRKDLDVAGKIDRSHLRDWQTVLTNDEKAFYQNIERHFDDLFNCSQTRKAREIIINRHQYWATINLNINDYTFGNMIEQGKISKSQLLKARGLYQKVYGFRIKRRGKLLISKIHFSLLQIKLKA